jgi:hypothetical protein
MRYQHREKKWIIWGIFLIITFVSISVFFKHSKSSYLPEKIRNSTFVDEFDIGGLCGIRLFILDEDTSEHIKKIGISYLKSDKDLNKQSETNPYGDWKKTPVPEENLVAMGGFYCASDSIRGKDRNLDKIGLVKGEVESDRSYYITTKNQEAAIFVLPRFSLIVFAYQDR